MAAKKSNRAAFAEDVQASTGGELRRIRPSDIRADHQRNTSRWAAYDPPEELRNYFGDAKICFTEGQIEGRLASLLAEGQIDPVDVSISNTGHPDLVKGFLRHCAFLLAEVRGVLDAIPGAKGTTVTGIRAQVVAAPKTQADHAAIARRNLAENRERQEMTPVDLARYIKGRLNSYDDDGVPVSMQQVCAELGLKKRSVERYLQLFTLRPDTLLAVHEGRLAMTAALKDASKHGEGTARGSNGGIGRKTMRRRDRNERPSHRLAPEQLDQLMDVVNGDILAADVTDDAVQAWVRYYDAPAPPREPKKPRKKPAPKPGEQRPASAETAS